MTLNFLNIFFISISETGLFLFGYSISFSTTVMSSLYISGTMPGIKYSLMSEINIALPIKEHTLSADTKILIMIRATRKKTTIKNTKRVY